MKIDGRTRFPHPVLSSNTGDYRNATFSTDITFVESFSQGSLRLKYVHTLTEKSLFNLVKEGKAAMGLFVTCAETYFSRLIKLDPFVDYFDFEPGTLRGRVNLQPMIWLTEDTEGIRSANLHEEYGGVTGTLRRGAILATADQQEINVGREKLAPLSTIFSLADNAGIPEGRTAINLDGEKIAINASGETYKAISEMRELNSKTRAILLNAVFLPTVMEVLANLSDGGESQFGSRRWFRVFSAKCDHLGIKNTEVLESAQKLLNSPFGKIVTMKETLAS